MIPDIDINNYKLNQNPLDNSELYLNKRVKILKKELDTIIELAARNKLKINYTYSSCL